MGTPKQIASYLTATVAYRQAFPEAARALALLASPASIATLFNRNHFGPAGHVTASALILDAQDNVCLLDHLALGRRLQPGGHVENGQTLIEAARQESQEETGLLDLQVHPWCVLAGGAGYRPLSIDQHDVPENKQRHQPPHIHTDFLFLLRTPRVSPPLSFHPSESAAIGWFALPQAARETRHLAASIERYMQF